MSKKNYFAKIIAKDPNGLQVISACCSEAKVKLDEIKFLKKNKLFLVLLERYKKEKNNNEKIRSICKFEFVDDVKSKNILIDREGNDTLMKTSKHAVSNWR